MHPLVSWTSVAFTLFGLYCTGLFDSILQQHWAHLAMNTAFLGTGLMLFAPVLGRAATRAGRGLPALGQMVMVFALMALHAGFSIWLLSRPDVVGSLRLPFVPDLPDDQRLGAILGWVLAEAPVLLAVAALMTRWAGEDRAAPVATYRLAPPDISDRARTRPDHLVVLDDQVS